jgi:hypothetical protein
MIKLIQKMKRLMLRRRAGARHRGVNAAGVQQQSAYIGSEHLGHYVNRESATARRKNLSAGGVGASAILVGKVNRGTLKTPQNKID